MPISQGGPQQDAAASSSSLATDLFNLSKRSRPVVEISRRRVPLSEEDLTPRPGPAARQSRSTPPISPHYDSDEFEDPTQVPRHDSSDFLANQTFSDLEMLNYATDEDRQHRNLPSGAALKTYQRITLPALRSPSFFHSEIFPDDAHDDGEGGEDGDGARASEGDDEEDGDEEGEFEPGAFGLTFEGQSESENEDSSRVDAGVASKPQRHARHSAAKNIVLEDGTDDNGSEDVYEDEDDGNESAWDDEAGVEEEPAPKRKSVMSRSAKNASSSTRSPSKKLTKARKRKRSASPAQVRKGGPISAAQHEILQKARDAINALIDSTQRETGLSRPRVNAELGLGPIPGIRARNICNVARAKYAVDSGKEEDGKTWIIGTPE